jgi:hypothetical protein
MWLFVAAAAIAAARGEHCTFRNSCCVFVEAGTYHSPAAVASKPAPKASCVINNNCVVNDSKA